MAYFGFDHWPKWDRDTNFDQFLLEWNSVCASRGDFKNEQKMALLSQALPRSMGADIQTWANAQKRTWAAFIEHVRVVAKETQTIPPFKLLKRAIHSPSFKQKEEETLSAFHDRFKLKTREYNMEAESLGKPMIEGVELVDLFEKNLLPGYRAALIEKRYEQEDREEQMEREKDKAPETKINLSWAYRACRRYQQTELAKQEIMNEATGTGTRGGNRSLNPLQRRTSERSFGSHLLQEPQDEPEQEGKFTELQEKLQKMEREMRRLKAKQLAPQGSQDLKVSQARFDVADEDEGPKDPPRRTGNRRKPRLVLPWSPHEVHPMYGFGPPVLDADGCPRKWCIKCATEQHTSRACDQYCARCGGQHCVDDCVIGSLNVTCTHCGKTGHETYMCIPQYEIEKQRKEKEKEESKSKHAEQNGQQQQSSPNRREGRNGRSTRRECLFWSQGSCWNGDNCAWTHTGRGGTEPRPDDVGRARGNRGGGYNSRNNRQGGRNMGGNGDRNSRNGNRQGWRNPRDDPPNEQPRSGGYGNSHGSQINQFQGHNPYRWQEPQGPQGHPGFYPPYGGGHTIHPDRRQYVQHPPRPPTQYVQQPPPPPTPPPPPPPPQAVEAKDTGAKRPREFQEFLKMWNKREEETDKMMQICDTALRMGLGKGRNPKKMKAAENSSDSD